MLVHDGVTADDGRRRRSLWWRLGVAAVALTAFVVVVVLWARTPPGTLEGPAGKTSAFPSAAPMVEAGPVPVCGFPVLDSVTEDGVDEGALDGVRTVVDNVVTVSDSEPVTFRVAAGSAFVLEREDATYTMTRYDLDSGERTATTTIELEADDNTETFSTDYVEVDDAGDIYLLDTLGGRRDLLKVAPDGGVVWRATLPAGPQTTGAVLDLYGLVRWADASGAEVLGVHESGRVLHRVSGDGQPLEPLELEGGVVGQLPDGRVVVSTDESDGEVDLRAVDAAGRTSLHLGASWQGERPFAVPRVPWTEPSGISTGPGEDGIVVAETGVGFAWYGEDGVFRGVWPDSRTDLEQPFALWDRTPVLRAGSDPRSPYYVLTHGAEGGFSLTKITAERMSFQLTATKAYSAANEPVISRLGLGAGLALDRPYGVFPDGVSPEVRAVFDDAWSPWADVYRLRYQVRGDPRVPDPVVGEETTVDLPPDGGEILLDLPETRPGAYEVDAALVRADTGEAVSGTCLRYTVAAPGSSLDLGALADGADWGGASPLRGVQLADQLGVGSHRTQLDFGAIVPDPTAAPDRSELVWDSLPDAAFASGEHEAEDQEGDADPFTELAAAAELADETGVLLILQLGQGGEAEQAAVRAGTWEGWVRAIAADVHEHAPAARHWEPWNEPNNTGYADAASFEKEVGAPFARAVRSVVPDAVVVGGNTLGIVPDWWADLVAAGGCDSLDVVAIHPYTGFNRSWEEEGFSLAGAELDRLREAIGPCGDVPVWDTESGWWSDGVANLRASAWDVARKLLWYGVEDVEEWTYFFSEGGFGEAGVSWSLVQYGDYLKPAGAVFAATAPFLDGFEGFAPVEVGAPGVHAVRAAAEDGSELLALWSEDLALPVRVAAADRAVSVVLRDSYGAVRPMEVPVGGVEVAVNGAPIFLVAPAGAGLEVAPLEAFGPDVLEGRPASASSTHPDASRPAVVTSGTFAVRDPWRSGRLADGTVDETPYVEVTTDGPVVVDRVAVATAGIRCCTSGLRDYTVSVQTPDGRWRDVGEVRDQFWERVVIVRFDPVEVTAVRVRVPMTTERGIPVLAANYTGIVGGLHPGFIPLATESEWIVTVSAIRAWGPDRTG